ncbi:MAG: CDP-alcohol phosphatidyltransferase family protein [Patescibacteria group bacterium]
MLNLPNCITLLRLPMIAGVVLFLSMESTTSDRAAVLLAVAIVGSDVLDGYIAKKYSQITEFGQFIDPLVDKLFIASALLALFVRGEVAVWVIVVILGRDLAVTALRAYLGRKGASMPAVRAAQHKTTLQSLMVILLIAVSGNPLWLQGLIWITVGVTLYTGFRYFLTASALLQERKTAK